MNEIKVGQWARGYCTESEVGCVVIGKITKIVDNCLVINDDYWLVNGYGNKIEVSNNLVDLLEVGDIVHLKHLRKHEFIIKSKEDLSIIRSFVVDLNYKITAIELHENRVKQVIGNG